MSFAPAVPVLRMFDEAFARTFWVDFLGFRVEFEHRFAPGMPLYLGLVRDGCTLHLSQHFGDACPGGAVRIPVAGLDAFLAGLPKDYGFARPGAAEEMPWGSREITITDPAGNRVTFAEPVVAAAAGG